MWSLPAKYKDPFWVQMTTLILINFSQGVMLTTPFTLSVYMVRRFLSADLAPGEAVSEAQVSKLTGLLAGTFSIAQFTTSMIWGTVSNIIGRKGVILVGTAASVMSMIWYGLSSSYAMAVTARALGGLLNGILGAWKVIIGETGDTLVQGKMFGYMSVAWGMGTTVGPLIGGALAQPCVHQPGMALCEPGQLLYDMPFALPCLVGSCTILLSGMASWLCLKETLPPQLRAEQLDDLSRQWHNTQEWCRKVWCRLNSRAYVRIEYISKLPALEEDPQNQAAGSTDVPGLEKDPLLGKGHVASSASTHDAELGDTALAEGDSKVRKLADSPQPSFVLEVGRDSECQLSRLATRSSSPPVATPADADVPPTDAASTVLQACSSAGESSRSSDSKRSSDSGDTTVDTAATGEHPEPSPVTCTAHDGAAHPVEDVQPSTHEDNTGFIAEPQTSMSQQLLQQQGSSSICVTPNRAHPSSLDKDDDTWEDVPLLGPETTGNLVDAGDTHHGHHHGHHHHDSQPQPVAVCGDVDTQAVQRPGSTLQPPSIQSAAQSSPLLQPSTWLVTPREVSEDTSEGSTTPSRRALPTQRTDSIRDRLSYLARSGSRLWMPPGWAPFRHNRSDTKQEPQLELPISESQSLLHGHTTSSSSSSTAIEHGGPQQHGGPLQRPGSPAGDVGAMMALQGQHDAPGSDISRKQPLPVIATSSKGVVPVAVKPGCGVASQPGSPRHPQEVIQPWHKNRQVLLTITGYGFTSFLYCALDEVLPIFAAAPVQHGGLGLAASQLAPPITVYGICLMVYSGLIYPWLQKRVGTLPLTRWGLAGAFVTCALIPASHAVLSMGALASQFVLYSSMVIKSFAQCSSFTGALVMVNAAPHKSQLGTVNGVGQTLAALVRGAGPALGGLVWALSVVLSVPGQQFMPFALVSLLAVSAFFVFGKVQLSNLK